MHQMHTFICFINCTHSLTPRKRVSKGFLSGSQELQIPLFLKELNLTCLSKVYFFKGHHRTFPHADISSETQHLTEVCTRQLFCLNSESCNP